MNLIEWLQSLPKQDFKREYRIAVTNCQDIHDVTKHEHWLNVLSVLSTLG